jgi:anti-sigma factor RsiW
MSSRLDNFSDDDALLVMYLANELSPADKRGVEDRLATDSALRAALSDLRAAQSVYDDALRRLDAATPLPMPVEAATQRAGRLTRNWMSGRMARPRLVIKRRQLSFPWWSYPFASAAALAIAVTLWGVQRYHNRHNADADPQVSVAVAIDDLSPDQQDGLLMYPSDGAPGGDDAEAAALDQADNAIAAVQTNDDLDSLLLNIGGDTDNGKVLP